MSEPEVEREPTPISTISIVVTGMMNPTIHHPVWYFQRGLLTEHERDLALATPDLFVTLDASRFSFGPFTIACQRQRWDLTCTDQAQHERLTKVAEVVYDSHLTHTPTQAFGWNWTTALRINSPADACLSKHVRTMLGIDLVDGLSLASATTTLSLSRGAGKVNLTLTPSAPAASFMIAAINCHHDVIAENPEIAGKGNFNIGPMIARAYEPDRMQKDALLTQVARTLRG